jgi:hypothetical protein
MIALAKTPHRVAPAFDVHQQRALEAVAADLSYRPCPRWLGNFSFATFGGRYPALPESLTFFVAHLATLVPDVAFNTVFVQRYCAHEFVGEHRDPKNNLDVTIIAPVGTWTGGESIIMGTGRFAVAPGDALVLNCWREGKSAPPRHALSKIESGTRYALILNRIV